MPKNEGTPRRLSPEMLQQLADGLTPVKKGTVPVPKGNQRESMISVVTPAMGRLPRLSIRLVGDCAQACNLESRTPGALRADKNDKLPGYLVFEPVQTYDKTALDHYELKWSDGNRALSIDLMEILQPRNMVVPKGYVTEIPLVLDELPTGRSVLILYLHDAKTREMRSAEREAQAGKREIAAADEADDEANHEETE